MQEVEINLLAVLVAAAINMGVGMAWYGALAKPWMQAVGKTREELSTPNIGYVVTTFGSIVMAYVVANFVRFAEAETLMHGAIVGLWLWFGLVATTMIANHIFESRPWSLYAINVGYPLVSLVLMGALLAIWR